MSDYRAVAAATETLYLMLRPAVEKAIPGSVSFTFSPPQAMPQISQDANVNIYMFQVYANPDFRNRDLPVRAGDGTLLERPEMAIDLDYLISFYAGKDEKVDKLYSQKLLGAVVGALHAQGRPRRDQLPAGSDHGGLGANWDLLRFTPIRLTRDDMSKLWSVHYQVPYQLSVAYRCSALLLEPMPVDEISGAREAWIPKPSLPPRGTSMSPQPGMPPVLESIAPQVLEFQPGAEVTLRGRSLGAKPIAVRVGDREVEPTSSERSELTFRLPPDSRAGVQPVRVLLGPRDGARVDSNSLPLVIQPRIVDEPQVVTRTVRAATVKVAVVNISPIVEAGQRVELLLNALPPASREAPAYRCRGERYEKPRNLVEVPIDDVEKGRYLMRVEVDGATSSLTQNVQGTFDGPEWEVK